MFGRQNAGRNRNIKVAELVGNAETIENLLQYALLLKQGIQ